MKKLLQVLNILFFAVTIYFNYASAAGTFHDTTQAMMSAKYDTLFTPAGYAFSIWGLIYLLLFGFVIYQGRSLVTNVRDDSFIERTGWWFILSCIGNCAWCYLFVGDYILASTFVIFFMLFCLIQIVLRNSMELWDAPITVIVFLWWPFVIYSGWLTVACIANVTLYLTKIGWDGFGISPVSWTIVMIIIATVVNLIVTWKRNMREFALVGAWALVAISMANWDTETYIKSAALVAAGLLLISSGFHAIKNRATNPAVKCFEYLKHRGR